MLATLIAGILLPLPGRAVDSEEPDAKKFDYAAASRRVGGGLAVGFDVVIIRPLAVCATIIGSVLFVPVFLISAAGGREARDEALELFVLLPAKAVYERPLGQF